MITSKYGMEISANSKENSTDWILLTYLDTKKLIVTTLVFPIMLYAAETWTLKQNTRIRILKAACQTTNISILKEVHEEQSLSNILFGMAIKYFGYLTYFDTGLENIVIQRRVEEPSTGEAEHQPDGRTRYAMALAPICRRQQQTLATVLMASFNW